MGGWTALVGWLWGISVGAQAVLCGVLFIKGNFRKIPIFTTYVAANLCQAILMFAIYKAIGFRSQGAIAIGWSSQTCIQILRAAATTEALRQVLKPFRGIWGLAWRFLVAAFGVIFLVVVFSSGRNVFWAILLMDRGFHVAFAVALVACLLLVHHYSVPIPSGYKALLGGFCFYSCTVVLTNTFGAILFLRRNLHYEAIWQLATVGAFIAVLLVWTVALRNPLPEPIRTGKGGGPEISYGELSPQINERLRLLNELLNRLWKFEVTRN